MVIDKIENYKLYANLSNKIAKAFDYINENDLNQMESGKHVIDHDDMYILIQEYVTKNIEDGKLEGHFKYIDLQYMIQGSELIGVSTLRDQNPIDINEKSDCAYFSNDSSFIRLDEGMFTIFFPDDLHMPCIKLNLNAKVKKAVIKIRV